ncbi:MAG TPA: hypothetical protein VM534_08165 [Thermoanaerobaculia bacterium]|nr:hypothetical protein [Thermoanaerobaculia bacterium]
MANRASWHTDENDRTWDRIKAAFRNDWEQTKHDFGADTARDLDQDVDDTVKQMAGSKDAFENHEQAFRFGHSANRNFRSQHPSWNDDLDMRLRQDYTGDYDRDRQFIRYAYEYRYPTATDMGTEEGRAGRRP